MQLPRLTFACELNPVRLTELFADGSVLADLRTLRARVTLMLSDLSSQRAAVVRQLNAAGVPVLAIPLLPFEEGYYFTADNPDRAAARYEEWKTWTQQHGLVWDGVGLGCSATIPLSPVASWSWCAGHRARCGAATSSRPAKCGTPTP
jgi:hypothetical protein